MAHVSARSISKFYSDRTNQTHVKAVNEVSFTCSDGEFLVLLGPSGCGKTSTLRMIAGLEEIDRGDIFIGNRRVNDLSPNERNVAMAFENYALYPSLTVRENLMFPLRARRVEQAEIVERIAWIAGMLELQEVLDRRPAELSGGLQQRVSLGRCLIRDAEVYLMDEPLSHLDSELRLYMRGELKRIHVLQKRTVIYVTHDQIEALALADRIAVLNNGLLHQIDTPEAVFERPANMFVAGFLGEPPMNFLEGTIRLVHDEPMFYVANTRLKVALPRHVVVQVQAQKRDQLVLGIRPHRIALGHRERLAHYSGAVIVYESLGEEGVLEIDLEGCILTMLVNAGLRLQPRERVPVSIDWHQAILFDAEAGNLICFPDAQE